MPRTVYLLRHAQAEPLGDGTPDRERMLTKDGQHEAREVAKAALGLRPRIGAIYVSPYSRCVQTAQPIAEELDLPIHTAASLGKYATPDPAFSYDMGHGGAILVCSHHEQLPVLVQRLTGTVMRRDKVDTMVRIDLDESGRGALVWQARPGQLTKHPKRYRQSRYEDTGHKDMTETEPLQFSAAGGHWVTIEQDGEYTHIFLSHGVVTKGPKHLIGAKAGHLPPIQGKRTVTHHPEGHEPKGAKDHPSYTEHQPPDKKKGRPYAREHGAEQSRQQQGPEPLSKEQAEAGLAKAQSESKATKSQNDAKAGNSKEQDAATSEVNPTADAIDHGRVERALEGIDKATATKRREVLGTVQRILSSGKPAWGNANMATWREVERRIAATLTPEHLIAQKQASQDKSRFVRAVRALESNYKSGTAPLPAATRKVLEAQGIAVPDGKYGLDIPKDLVQQAKALIGDTSPVIGQDAPTQTQPADQPYEPRPQPHFDENDVRKSILRERMTPAHELDRHLVERLRRISKAEYAPYPVIPNGKVKPGATDAVAKAINSLPRSMRDLVKAAGVTIYAGGKGASAHLSHTIRGSQRHAYGVFAPQLREIHVHGNAIDAGKHEYVGLHEMGHAVDFSLGRLRRAQGEPSSHSYDEIYSHAHSNTAQLRSLWGAHISNKKLPPNMRSEPVEFFADAFALYWQHPEQLKEAAPDVYDYMDRIPGEVKERVKRAID